MVGFSFQLMVKLESSGGSKREEQYILEKSSPTVWQRETLSKAYY